MTFAATWPVPDADGCVSAPLPCGHVDEILTPDQQLLAAPMVLAVCPVCGNAYCVMAIDGRLLPRGLRPDKPVPGVGIVVLVGEPPFPREGTP